MRQDAAAKGAQLDTLLGSSRARLEAMLDCRGKGTANSHAAERIARETTSILQLRGSRCIPRRTYPRLHQDVEDTSMVCRPAAQHGAQAAGRSSAGKAEAGCGQQGSGC